MDESVKFWQIGTPSNPIETEPKSTSLISVAISSITLQAKDGIVISSDSDGMVRTWDILTGVCKTFFQTPVKDFYKRDVQLINGQLILTWNTDEGVNIWDVEKGELLLAIDRSNILDDLKISGDGSKVFCLSEKSIQALSIQTGEVVGEVEIIGFEGFIGTLNIDGTRVWVHHPSSEYHGWDFGILGSLPIQLPDTPTLSLNGTMQWDTSQSRITDVGTGKVVFQLSGRFENPTAIQCDGCFLAAGYESGEVLILDITYISPQ